MRHVLGSLLLAAVLVSGSALARPRKTAPAGVPEPPVAEQSAGECPPPAVDHGRRCYALGDLVGQAAYGLTPDWRARTRIFAAYCAQEPLQGLGRVPTDQEVNQVEAELTAFLKHRTQKPYLDTEPLRQQMRGDQAREGQMLDDLLK